MFYRLDVYLSNDTHKKGAKKPLHLDVIGQYMRVTDIKLVTKDGIYGLKKRDSCSTTTSCPST